MKRFMKRLFVVLLVVALSSTGALAAKGNARKTTTKNATKNTGKTVGRNVTKLSVPQTELNVFFKLCEEGNVGELERLLTEKKMLVNARGKYSYKLNDINETHDGMTGLHVATINNKIDVVDLLLNRGANVDAKNANGFSALHYAATCGSIEIAEKLVSTGAKIEIIDNDKLSPICYAAALGHSSIVALFLKQGISTEAFYPHIYFPLVSDEKFTLLMIAAFVKQPDVVKLLLNAGADVDAKNNYGETALLITLNTGYSNQESRRLTEADVVGQLIEAGADVNVRDKGGRSALMQAARWGKKEAVGVLLKVEDAIRERAKNIGMDDDFLKEAPDSNKQSQLYSKFVGALTVVNARDNYGWTPVMYAAHYPKSGDALNALLEYGVDLKARDKDGHNVLWHLNQNKEMPPEEKKAYSDKIFTYMQQ